MNLGKTAVVVFGSKIIISITGFIGTMVIARELGPASLGVYTVVLSVLFWLTIPSNAITSAISKRVSENQEPGQFLTTGFIITSGFTIGSIIIIVIFQAGLNQYLGADIHTLFAVLLAGHVAFDSVIAGLNGQKRVSTAGAAQAAEHVLRVALQIGLILTGFELIALIVGQSVSYILIAGVFFFLYHIRLQPPAWARFVELISYAKYSWLGSLKGRVFGSLDNLVLAWFVSSTLIGIYGVAWSLASVLTLLNSSISQTLFPELSELGVNDDYERIHHYLNEALVFTGIFSIPGLFGSVILGPRILRIYGPEFSQGSTVILILIIARMLAAFGSQFINILNAIDRPDVAFRVNLIFIAANLIMNILFIRFFGWYGAAVATAISAGVSLGLSYASLASLIGAPQIPYREIGFEVFAAGVMAAVLAGFVNKTVPDNHFITIGLVLFGAGIYAIVLLTISPRIRQKVIATLPVSTQV